MRYTDGYFELLNKISCIHAVGTPRIGIAVTVAQATLCDFQLDTILQPLGLCDNGKSYISICCDKIISINDIISIMLST